MHIYNKGLVYYVLIYHIHPRLVLLLINTLFIAISFIPLSFTLNVYFSLVNLWGRPSSASLSPYLKY